MDKPFSELSQGTNRPKTFRNSIDISGSKTPHVMKMAIPDMHTIIQAKGKVSSNLKITTIILILDEFGIAILIID